MALAITAVFSILIIVIDQIIKYFIYNSLSPNGVKEVIPGLFSLVYSENRGAAFGVFQNATIIFSVITVVLVAVFLYLLISKKFTGKLFTASVILIIGGGIGNLIDRIFRGFVIDYLSVSFFPPICNFADYCITVGAALLIISILFLSENRKKLAEDKNSEDDSLVETVNSETDGDTDE